MSRVLGRAGGRVELLLLEDMVDCLCRPFSSHFFNLSQYLRDLLQLFYAVYMLKLGTRYDYQNDKGASIWLTSESISIPPIKISPGDGKGG